MTNIETIPAVAAKLPRFAPPTGNVSSSDIASERAQGGQLAGVAGPMPHAASGKLADSIIDGAIVALMLASTAACAECLILMAR